MPPQPPVNPRDNAQLGRTPAAPAVVEGPPDEEFWDRYNKRMEFPTSWVVAVFLHVLVAAILIGVFTADKSSGGSRDDTPLKLVAVGGLDDDGEGRAGSGGVADPVFQQDPNQTGSDKTIIPTPEKLSEARENIKQIVTKDPTASIPIAAHNAAAYEQLNDSVKQKLLGGGAQKGEGAHPGKGFDGTKGTGPGGAGNDDTLKRSLRWVLRFSVRSGRDYLDQLRAMKAEILVPIPPDEKDCLIFPDLNDLKNVRKATDEDFRRLAKKVRFADTRRDAVFSVAGALGLDFSPKTFWAFFPPEIEAELAREETKYRNRRPEDIEETIFRVVIVGGQYEIRAIEQKVKR